MQVITPIDRFKVWTNRYEVWIQRLAIAVIIISAGAIIWALPMKELGELLQQWAERLGLWGALIFLLAFIALTLTCLPVWPMPFIAGAVFGPWWGTGLASLSCTAAAALSFFLSRMIGRTTLRRYLENSPRMRALEKTVKAANWKIVAAVRLSHFLPFGAQNYAFGLTGIGFWVYAITTWAITLPGTFLQAYIGDLGFSSMESWQGAAAADWQVWGLRGLGLAAIASAVLYIGHLGRSVYREAVAAELEKAVEEETAADERPHWSWPTLSLSIGGVLIAGLATWSVIERESLQSFVEQQVGGAAKTQSPRRSSSREASGEISDARQVAQTPSPRGGGISGGGPGAIRYSSCIHWGRLGFSGPW